MITFILVLIVIAIVLNAYIKKQHPPKGQPTAHPPNQQQSYEEHPADITYTLKAQIGKADPNFKDDDKTITVNIDLDEIIRNRHIPAVDIDISDDWITIRSLGFFGECQKSPNGLYIIAFCDSHEENGKNKRGRIVLLKQSTIIYEKALQRPNDAKVADNGYVVVNDWVSYGNELAGIFYAFDSQGNEIIKQRFKANMNGNAITASGSYAACSTAFSEYDAHSDMTFLYDLRSKTRISKIESASYDIRIDEASQTVHLDEKGMHLIYEFTGKCLQDSSPSNPNWFSNTSGYNLYTVLSEELASKDPNTLTIDDYQYYIKHFKAAIETIPSTNWKSNIYVHLGDIYITLNMPDDAKQCYESALLNNPKAPVKRKLQKLNKS